jgi:hypothetical protein
VPNLSIGLTGLSEELASALGQLRVHEHELGGEGTNDGMLDETNSRRFLVKRHAGKTRSRSIGEPF